LGEKGAVSGPGKLVQGGGNERVLKRIRSHTEKGGGSWKNSRGEKKESEEGGQTHSRKEGIGQKKWQAKSKKMTSKFLGSFQNKCGGVKVDPAKRNGLGGEWAPG